MERKFERSDKKNNPTGFGKINQKTRDFSLDAETIKEQQEKD